MIAYFDASALVKLLLFDEAGHEDAAALLDGAALALSSRVSYAEVRAALAAARRADRLTPRQFHDSKRAWSSLWQSLRIVELSEDLDEPCGALADTFGLRGFDAIHLASALLIGTDGVVVATWDARLHAAARVAGCATLPGQAPRSQSNR